jgi:plastocyanin
MSVVTREKKDAVVDNALETGVSKGIFTRVRNSTLSKIAFWASFVGLLASTGGVVALTIINKGSPSVDIVIMAACALLSTIILATRFRWAPLVSALLLGYNLYLIFLEPFVTESLANPKGPNGGLAHFIMDVQVIACAIVAFGACVAAGVQNYGHGSRQAPRWLPVAWSAVLGMVVGAVFIGVISQPALPTGTSYTNGVATVHVGAGNFLQSSVTISKGSKLLLVDDTSSTHDLFNGQWQNSVPVVAQEPGAPVVSNVQLKGSSIAIGPFATAGTYHIFCTIHRGMNLTIIVQ